MQTPCHESKHLILNDLFVFLAKRKGVHRAFPARCTGFLRENGALQSISVHQSSGVI